MYKKLDLQKGYAHIQMIVMGLLVIGAITVVGGYVIYKSKAVGVTPTVSDLAVSQTSNMLGASWTSSYVTTSGYWRLYLVSQSGDVYGTESTIINSSTRYSGTIDFNKNLSIPKSDSYKVRIDYCSTSTTCSTLATSSQ
jgi:hypothetical protein